MAVYGKKHILFVSSWYPNKNNPVHGIFNYYFAQAALLNHRVSVLHVCSNEHQKSEFEIEESTESGIFTVRVYYRKVKNKIPFISNLYRYRKLKQAFEKGYSVVNQNAGKPDMAQLNVAMPAGIGLMHLSKKYGWPYVLNENWSGYCAEDGNYKGFFLKRFTRKIVAGARVIMPTSDFLKRAMLAHGLNGRYLVVPNVVNTSLFVPLQKKVPVTLRLLHISSLTNREKNVSGIIRAFANALKTQPEMELIIAGDGPEREKLEQQAKQSGCGQKIIFKGRLNTAGLVEEINLSSCLLMFSFFETFSLVIMEAFACGKPVITSNAGAIKEYMKPELGLVVDAGDESQLTSAILKFSHDRQRFNPEFIRNFAVGFCGHEKVAGQLNDIYNSVLENKF